MDESPITLTSIILIAVFLIILGMILYRYFGNRETFWSRSYKEEKIGLSAHKLFKPNGYMIHSGSELLLSSSGSFKRFDTVDKESCKNSQNSPKHATTPLWNLSQNESEIPPQPLRPAPAPCSSQTAGSVGHTKIVTFSVNLENESPFVSQHNSRENGDMFRSGILQSNLKRPVDIPVLEAPPQTKLTNNIVASQTATAIPRPVVKKSPQQNGFYKEDNPQQLLSGSSDSDPDQLQRANNTNPFLENLPKTQPNSTALKSNNQTTTNEPAITIANPFVETHNINDVTSSNIEDHFSEKGLGLPRTFRNRSFSETVADDKEESATISLRNLTNAFHTSPNTTPNPGNPFSHVARKIKGPHMLQKTISEDFLFRKIGTAQNANGVINGNNGTNTWSFGRLLMQEDASFNLWRRNSSQTSLDSGSMASLDGVNLERAISCDSVDSDLSTTGFTSDFDQSTYTQITGYLCVGLHYDKNSITEEGMDLQVSVLEAKGLVLPFKVDSLDTFVRIYLVPDQAGALQTKIVKDSPTPTYNETLNFWLTRQQTRHSLWFHLYHNGSAHTLIGEAEMEIGEMPKPITTWIPLTDSRKCNAKWGELMFSLSYLPTAERLTIVVVKARNIQLQVPSKGDPNKLQDIQNVFVKVYLMNNEKKVLKKRTSLKRKDRCPVFNESVIFSLPPQSLTTTQLRLTVFGVIDETTVTPLGHVVAGSCATGKGLRHWHQMLSSLRKPVAMWHVLRRVTNQPVFTGGADAVVAAMQTTAQRAKRNSVF
ncbi:Synaptotagmin-12 [Lucilia cuprina]|nr:Synaptotagmin-12 [Lucilia cuprina]KAI8127922.1 Synaptotagmin-12 [Lucilia cuprina]